MSLAQHTLDYQTQSKFKTHYKKRTNQQAAVHGQSSQAEESLFLFLSFHSKDVTPFQDKSERIYQTL